MIADKAGFRKSDITGIIIQVATVSKVDVMLTIGSIE